MRKKLLLVVLVSCLLIGCGNKKPDDVSEEVYDMAVYAIDVVDLYLDGEATIEETDEKLEQFDIDLDYDDGEYEGDSSVEVDIIVLQTRVSSLELGYGTTTITDVKEARNELAETINYKE